MGIHSYSDFNLHIPANVLVLVAIMAIGYAALHLEGHRRRDVIRYRYYQLPLKYRGSVVLVLMVGSIGWAGWWSVRHFVAEAWCHTVPNSTLNRDPHPPMKQVMKAIGWDGGNAEYWHKLAEAGDQGPDIREQGSKVKGQEEESRQQMTEDGRQSADGEGQPLTSQFRRRALERAVGLNPFEAQYHLRLGWAYAHLWKEPDYHTRWLPAADISMDRASYFGGVKNPNLHQELGNYWTMRSRSVYPSDPLHQEAWARACRHYQQAQRLEDGRGLKKVQKEIREYVWNFYPDEMFVAQVMISLYT